MYIFKFISCLILLSASTAFSQQSDSLLGKWTGFMTSQGGRETAVELVIGDTGGTWRFTLQGGGKNPCLGKAFPVSVTAHSATELSLDINGAKVLKGCIQTSASLTSSDGKSLQGKLGDGRRVKLSRQ